MSKKNGKDKNGNHKNGNEFELNILKLRRDLDEAAKGLSAREARYIVDLYYQIQEYRKRASNQILSMGSEGEPVSLLQYVLGEMEAIEGEIKRWMGVFTDYEKTGMGLWLKAHRGIGPVLAAALLAHIDISRVHTAGAIWRFGGLDPSLEWLGTKKAGVVVTDAVGDAKVVTYEQLAEIAQATSRRPERLIGLMRAEKERAAKKSGKPVNDDGKIVKKDLVSVLASRPWNAKLKVIFWKIGESFMKTCNSPDSQYGKLYADHKAKEAAKNERGEFKQLAEKMLEKKHYDKSTNAYKAYVQGKLPDGQILSRAKLHATKIFLAHFFEESYRRHYKKEPPLPYPIAHLGHSHVIEHQEMSQRG